jgi:hypothetical protein
VTTLLRSNKRQILRQVTFTPASGNIYQHYLNEYKAKPVIHNKDWRFKLMRRAINALYLVR